MQQISYNQFKYYQKFACFSLLARNPVACAISTKYMGKYIYKSMEGTLKEKSLAVYLHHFYSVTLEAN